MLVSERLSNELLAVLNFIELKDAAKGVEEVEESEHTGLTIHMRRVLIMCRQLILFLDAVDGGWCLSIDFASSRTIEVDAIAFGSVQVELWFLASGLEIGVSCSCGCPRRSSLCLSLIIA